MRIWLTDPFFGLYNLQLPTLASTLASTFPLSSTSPADYSLYGLQRYKALGSAGIDRASKQLSPGLQINEFSQLILVGFACLFRCILLWYVPR
jgi:hypothetical protein